MDVQFILINQHSGPHLQYTNQEIAQFLFLHLQEYGDPVEDISKAIQYVYNKGGVILLAIVNQEIAGAVIINETGMEGYIPENILVYIAVDQNQRGMGIGKQLIENIKKVTKGGIALHVEPDNPAVHLYKKLGFENKYLEMRFTR